MSAVAGERGFALTELLVAMVIFAVVLTATLTPLDSFHKAGRRNELQNEAQDRVRLAIGKVTRELRSAAAATQVIEKAGAQDLVFQAVDPSGPGSGDNVKSIQRLRYCLDSSTPTNGKLWRQRQTWTSSSPPAMPSTSTCPGSAWPSQRIVADAIVNCTTAGCDGGGDRPAFQYNAASPASVTSVRAELFVDLNPGQPPVESRLSTGVFLRNQNAAPVASFTATLSGDRHVLLDGSGSSDPEGGTLTYRWCAVSGCGENNKLGSGVSLDYVAPGAGSYTFYLQVTDGSGLTTESSPQTVSVP
jgi:prepilin-type N-terminal cleavage/methylation domain-containing protein